MNTVRQLIRQPVRLLCGVLMTALAVAALTVCLGQMLAARSAEQKLADTFHTTALLTDAFQYEEDVIVFPDGTEHHVRTPIYVMPEEISAWVEQTAAEHPETVKLLADHGLASAYIPALTMDNYTDYPPDGRLTLSDGQLGVTRSSSGISAAAEPMPFGTPYDCAMFEITLTEVEEVQRFGRSVLIMAGTIDKVIALHEGFPDPTGFTLRMSFRLPEPGDVVPEPGKRYLVYGTQYYDLDWALRHEVMDSFRVNQHITIQIDAFDSEDFHLYDDWTLEKYESYGTGSYTVGYYIHEGEHISISDVQYSQMRAVYLKLDSARNYGASESASVYEIPNIIHLDGTAEELLASPEGALWWETLEDMDVNYHAFPVLGVDKLGYVGEFARENARIVEGRDFTAEELASGARVCVISETVAHASGLQPGDTVSIRYYDPDRESPYQYFLESGLGTTNPAAYRYGSNTPFAGGPEEYTIVGLYRYSNAWASPASDPYAFTPNTIFVPKAAVTGEMSYAKQAVFRTVVLHNGTLPEFMAIAEDAGYEDLFVYSDQGYHAAAQSVAQYQIVAARAAVVGVLVYGIILVLFLFFFPLQQRKNIVIMAALGTDRSAMIGHILLDGFCILLLGTILGCVGGAVLWNAVIDVLMASAEVSLELELKAKGYAQIALGQLATAMFLTSFLAVPMTKIKSLTNRK